MKQALLTLVFVLFAAGLLHPRFVFAASSDDSAGNYVRRDPEDYNFLPLVLDDGVSTGNTGTLRDKISYNMVYDQGYEVQCAKPAWDIAPRVYGALQEYFKNQNAPAVTLSSTASYNIDFTEGTIPLFRGNEDLSDTTKVSSFEGYFGANYQKDTPPKTNSSGVANLLLNADGQCVAKYANLSSLFGDGGICSKLKNPEQCALDRDIAGTSFTTEKLYQTLDYLFSLKNESGENLNCFDINGGWNSELEEFGFTPQKFATDIAPAARALQITPLNLDVLYRLAFLVIAPQQNPIGDDGIFSFLQNKVPQPASGNQPPLNEDKHAPIVIGFKVPFLATNSIFSLPDLRDSSLLTAYSMTRIESLQREQESIISERNTFIDDIITSKKPEKSDSRIINCDGMPQCNGSGESQQLFAALVDIVNGSGQTCSDFKGPYENAGDLGSPAAASEEKEFQSPYFSEVLPQENSAGFSWSLRVEDENVQSEADKEKIPVTAHLITPYGTNIEYVAETLQSFFQSDDEETKDVLEGFPLMVKNNCIEDFNGECGLIPEYFTFGGITADLNSDSASHRFVANPEECESITDPTEREQCEFLSFSATLTEQPREPIRIIGAQLGWMIQKIQEKVRGIGSKTYEYIKECKRTEDLFLGRCLGYQGKPGGEDGSVVNSCSDYAGIQVELPADRNAYGDIVCDVANNNAMDVQLLWGLSQIEGHIMNNFIDEGRSSVSCADLILTSCGSSMIGPGLIVPQCVEVREDDPTEPTTCPDVAWAVDDGEAAKKYRESLTTDVVCSVKGTLEYMLALRKSQIGELKALYRAAHGTDPDTKQLYYMMAGKNNGTLSNEQLVSPACGDAPGIDPEGIGCSQDNYCVCAMDRFTYQCGQRV